jgi:phosphopantothenate synthetase
VDDELVTISAKVPKRLKRELEKEGVKLSDAVRRGLARELAEARLSKVDDELRRVDLSGLAVADVVKSVREDRDRGHKRDR